MPATAKPHSKHWLFLVASVGANMGLALALQRGWLDKIPDGIVVAIFVIAASSFVGWIWIHPWVKARRYLLYTYPKMALIIFVIVGGLMGGFAFLVTRSIAKRTPIPGTDISFVLMKPQVFFNDDMWSVLIEHRGHEALYNLEILIRDLDRFNAMTSLIKKGRADYTKKDLDELSKGVETTLKLPELDPSNRSYEASRTIYLKPYVPLHAHLTIYVSHRTGNTEQILRIESIGAEAGREKIQYATRIIDLESKKVLLECRDPEFPVDAEWSATLQSCFPWFLAPPPSTP